jgi:hypothetical protein
MTDSKTTHYKTETVNSLDEFVRLVEDSLDEDYLFRKGMAMS